MNTAYYDTTYLLKLQIVEAGTSEVRAHAASVFEIHTALHGRAEFSSAAFRKVREGAATQVDYQRLIAQFREDCVTETIILLPLTDATLDRVESVFATAPVAKPAPPAARPSAGAAVSAEQQRRPRPCRPATAEMKRPQPCRPAAEEI